MSSEAPGYASLSQKMGNFVARFNEIITQLFHASYFSMLSLHFSINSSDRPYICWLHKKQTRPDSPYCISALFTSITDAHCGGNVVKADSLILPDTVNDVFLYLKESYSERSASATTFRHPTFHLRILSKTFVFLVLIRLRWIVPFP
jgi:hypothetical protein